MEYCSLQDAYSSLETPSYANCRDGVANTESRKQERKKARKCRGPQQVYKESTLSMSGVMDSVDPDRPQVKKMEPVGAYNPSLGLKVHAPVDQDFDSYEPFVGCGVKENLPEIKKQVVGPAALDGESPKGYFGASISEPIGAQKKLQKDEDTFAPFVNYIGEDSTYTLQPDFAKSFGQKGASKAQGVSSDDGMFASVHGMGANDFLPFPTSDFQWKNKYANSSYYSLLRGGPEKTPEPEETVMDGASKKMLLEKIDQIFSRLDSMESSKNENVQTEILLFTMTGLGIIFLMDVACRAACGFRR